MLNKEKSFSKHSGVIGAIHKHFVKPGVLEKRVGKNLNWLFELRGLGDYGVTGHVPQEEARQAIQVAGEFVVQVKLFLDTQDISSS
ncbi:MAG: HEPN domain-containing protein [Spirochaetales bacterium]|nr:HEPN domain-containing protein [Spirochaetales bacterium]